MARQMVRNWKRMSDNVMTEGDDEGNSIVHHLVMDNQEDIVNEYITGDLDTGDLDEYDILMIQVSFQKKNRKGKLPLFYAKSTTMETHINKITNKGHN